MCTTGIPNVIYFCFSSYFFFSAMRLVSFERKREMKEVGRKKSTVIISPFKSRKGSDISTSAGEWRGGQNRFPGLLLAGINFLEDWFHTATSHQITFRLLYLFDIKKEKYFANFFCIICKNITEFNRLIAENHKTTRSRNVFLSVFQCDSQSFASFLKAIHVLIGQVRANLALQKSEVTTEGKTSFFQFLALPPGQKIP